MDKGLQLDIGHEVVDFLNFCNGELAGENDPARALLLPEPDGVLICDVGLRGDVHAKIGRGLAAGIEHAWIGDYRGVSARALKEGKVLLQGSHIAVFCKDIYGDVNFFAEAMGVRNGGLQLFAVEIVGKGAKRKGLAPHICRICAEVQRRIEFCAVARRG